jgi:DNA-binding NarL/FixJ family response regulator
MAPVPLDDPLSEREREVLAVLATGKTTSEAARDLFVSVGTIKSHTSNIYRKLGARNRAEAIARAHDLGLLP